MKEAPLDSYLGYESYFTPRAPGPRGAPARHEALKGHPTAGAKSGSGRGRTPSSYCEELDPRLWESKEAYSPSSGHLAPGPPYDENISEVPPPRARTVKSSCSAAPQAHAAPELRSRSLFASVLLCLSATTSYIVLEAEEVPAREPETPQRSACLGRRRSSFTSTRLKRMSVVPPGSRPVAEDQRTRFHLIMEPYFRSPARSWRTAGLTNVVA